MKDLFDREIDYLRISITDLCNLRCEYCMPSKGVNKLSHEDIISPERIQEIVLEAVKLGIKKIRITGGEPLIRKGVFEIISLIRIIPEIEEICLTTNGLLLEEYAQKLKDLGVNRLNISLDTLNENKYKLLTRGGDLAKVIRGIIKAKEVGFNNIKINAVSLKNINDDEMLDFVNFAKTYDLEVRFIELMPIGEGKNMFNDYFLSNESLYKRIISEIEDESISGVSRLYKLKGGKGKIGFISPLSNSFCSSCSRIRLTSDGKIKPCLHSNYEIDLNSLHGDDLLEALKNSILAKPKEHSLLKDGSKSLREMYKIGG